MQNRYHNVFDTKRGEALQARFQRVAAAPGAVAGGMEVSPREKGESTPDFRPPAPWITCKRCRTIRRRAER